MFALLTMVHGGRERQARKNGYRDLIKRRSLGRLFYVDGEVCVRQNGF